MSSRTPGNRPGQQDKQPARAQHDLARGSLDRHATYFVAAHVTGAAVTRASWQQLPWRSEPPGRQPPRPPGTGGCGGDTPLLHGEREPLMLRWHIPIPTPGSHAQPRHRVHTVVPGQRYLCLLRLWARRSSCSSHQSAPSGSSGEYRPAQRRTAAGRDHFLAGTRLAGTDRGTGRGVYGRNGTAPGATVGGTDDAGLSLSCTSGSMSRSLAWVPCGPSPRRRLRGGHPMCACILPGGHHVRRRSRTAGGSCEYHRPALRT